MGGAPIFSWSGGGVGGGCEMMRFFFFYGFSDASETHRSVFFRIPFRPRSGRRAFATIFSDFGEKVAQLAGSFFSKYIFEN